MKSYYFEGYSDDSFGEYGVSNIDHDNCASGEPIKFRMLDRKDPDLGFFVTGQYSPSNSACWSISIEPVTESHIPPWPVTVRPAKSGYSMHVGIEAPDDVVIECLEEEAE